MGLLSGTEKASGGLWLLAACISVLALAIPSPFITYDDGWNMHVLHLLQKGDASQLWHHGSPVFYLFWWPWVAAGVPYEALWRVNSLLGVLAIFVILKKTAPTISLPVWLALATLVCLSPIATINRACFTIEAGGLLLFGLGYKQAKLGRAALWLALAAMWNYKLGLLGALSLGYELAILAPKLRWEKTKTILLVSAGTFVALWLLYVLLNPIDLALRPLATYAGLLGRNANPQAHNPGLDALFYWNTTTKWDNAALWFGGLAGLVLVATKGKGGIAAWLVVFILIAGIFLPKAPRWLLPALPLVAAYIPSLLPTHKWGKGLVWAGMFCWGGWAVYLSIYPYAQVGARGNIEFSKVDTLLSLGSTLPYLASKPPKVQLLRTWPCGKISKVKYLFKDGYVYMAGYEGLWPSACILGTVTQRATGLSNACPLLWLEHAEYTGHTYTETMRRYKKYKTVSQQQELIVDSTRE